MRDEFWGHPLHARRWDPRWSWCEIAVFVGIVTLCVFGAMLAGLHVGEM